MCAMRNDIDSLFEFRFSNCRNYSIGQAGRTSCVSTFAETEVLLSNERSLRLYILFEQKCSNHYT